MKENDLVICPHCGEAIKKNARACPHCGADEETGWSANTYLDSIDLPDDESYEEMRDREFGGGQRRPPVKPWIYLTAIILLVLAALGFVVFLR